MLCITLSWLYSIAATKDRYLLWNMKIYNSQTTKQHKTIWKVNDSNQKWIAEHRQWRWKLTFGIVVNATQIAMRLAVALCVIINRTCLQVCVVVSYMHGIKYNIALFLEKSSSEKHVVKWWKFLFFAISVI